MTIASVFGCVLQYCLISSRPIIIKAVESASAVAASGADDQTASLPPTGLIVRGSIICPPFCTPEPLRAAFLRKGRASTSLLPAGLVLVRGQPFCGEAILAVARPSRPCSIRGRAPLATGASRARAQVDPPE